jgi:hypothetical protein
VIDKPLALIPAPTVLDREPLASPVQAYRLPKQFTLRYSNVELPLSAHSVLTWAQSETPDGTGYTAQWSIPSPGGQSQLKSSGLMRSDGLAPRRLDEQRRNGSVVASSIEPDNQRVIISSKAGFLPYDPKGQDLLSLLVQLAIAAQTQPALHQAGVQLDYTVYRPTGIKRWRFQSMGLNGSRLLELHRVPLGSEPDYEPWYQFVLDLNQQGLPAVIRWTDAKDKTSEWRLAEANIQ